MAVMNFPARGLWKRKVPIQSPKLRRKTQQRLPKKMQQYTDFWMICDISFLLSRAWISATVGSSIVETELVMAEGKRTHGSAIPVMTP